MMEQEASKNLEGLEIGALDASEVEEALGVISRGMRDNPIHIAVFGEDQERRQKSLHRLFGAAFAVMGLQEHMLVARSEDGRIMISEAEDGEILFGVERLLGDWSLTGGKLATTFDLLFRKRRRLRPRLKAEAARRGQAVPNVRFPGEERRP
jgi:hypothetical protein